MAPLGGDEFGLLLTGCTEPGAEFFVRRLYVELDRAGVAGSVGRAPISILRRFPAALADTAMYAAKRERRASRLQPPVLPDGWQARTDGHPGSRPPRARW